MSPAIPLGCTRHLESDAAREASACLGHQGERLRGRSNSSGSGKGWAPVHQSIAGPAVFVSAQQPCFWFPALRSVSGLQQLSFKIRLRLAFAFLDLDTISNCRRCRSAGCLATIGPVTHTVILRLGKIIHSGSVASWISFSTGGSGGRSRPHPCSHP
jgi:hypothetical protein